MLAYQAIAWLVASARVRGTGRRDGRILGTPPTRRKPGLVHRHRLLAAILSALLVVTAAATAAPGAEPMAAPVSAHVLGATGQIGGRVVTETGSPAAGVLVELAAPGGWPRYHASTDDAGAFVVTGLRAASYTVLLQGKGGRGATYWNGYHPEDSSTLSLRAGETIDGLEFVLAGPATIDLHLVDDVTGAPLAGLEVLFADAPLGTRSAEPEPRSGTTDAGGLVRFVTRSTGSLNVMFQSNEVYADQFLGHDGRGGPRVDALAVPVRAGDAWDLELRLVRSATVTGRVVDQDGEPVVTTVSVVPTGMTAASCSCPLVTSDRHGRWVQRVYPGAYDVIATGTPKTLRSSTSVEVAAGEKRQVDLVAAPAGHLTGVVVDTEGQPVAGAIELFGVPPQENASSPQAPYLTPMDCACLTTGPDGRFEWNGLAPGVVYVNWTDGKRLPTWYPNASHSSDARAIAIHGGETRSIRIVVEPAATLHGIVRDENGQAVDGARIEAVTPEEDRAVARGRQRVTVTDADGRFSLGHLGRGPYLIVVTPPPGRPDLTRSFLGDAYRARQAERIILEPGSTRRVTLTALPAAMATGTIHLPSGASVDAGVRVSGDLVTGVPVGTFTHDHVATIDETDLTGRYHLGGLAPGTYTISVRCYDGVLIASDRVTLDRGDRATLDLTLFPGIGTCVAPGIEEIPALRFAGRAAPGHTLRIRPWRTPDVRGRPTYRWTLDGRLMPGSDDARLRVRPWMRGHRIRALVVIRHDGTLLRLTSRSTRQVR